MKKKYKKENKKGFIRIIEAILAIMLLLAGVLVIMTKQIPMNNNFEEVNMKQRQILELISKNETIRGYVLNENDIEIKKVISNMIPLNWKYAITICTLDLICNSLESPSDKEVYSNEIIITSNLTEYAPKKLRIFVWMK